MKIIGHLDMDAFFAAIEERDHPNLKGLAIVIGANPQNGYGRGVVSTANYQAREYGIRSGLPIGQAFRQANIAKRKKLPKTIFLGVNMKKYDKVSKNIFKLLKKYSPTIEQGSVDEAYFDLSFTKNYTEAKKISKKIKQKIHQKEKLTCSIGIGPNKLISKIASDLKKPNGLTVILPDQIETFMPTLNLRQIPGIGPKTQILFNQAGVYNVAELLDVPKYQMSEWLGKWGEAFYEKIRGNDNSSLQTKWIRKSIGKQETFMRDSLDEKLITQKLDQLINKVYAVFQKSKFQNFKTITLTVRFADFETHNRSFTFKKPIDSVKIMQKQIVRLLAPFFNKKRNPYQKYIRLIGVRLEKLN